MAAPALTNPKEMGGGGILTYFFSLKVYPTNFMPFSLTIFADFWDLGGTSPRGGVAKIKGPGKACRKGAHDSLKSLSEN